MVLSRPMLPSALLVALGCLATPAAAAPTTCGEVKALYKEKACCGNPEKAVQVCPYSFQKPACDDAEPQAPRDLTTGATGQMDPKAAVLTEAQAEQLPLVNVHYHCGAEHKSDEYNDASDSEAFDSGRRLYEGSACRPGFMCDASGLTDDQKAPYTFQYCKGDVQVGRCRTDRRFDLYVYVLASPPSPLKSTAVSHCSWPNVLSTSSVVRSKKAWNSGFFIMASFSSTLSSTASAGSSFLPLSWSCPSGLERSCSTTLPLCLRALSLLLRTVEGAIAAAALSILTAPVPVLTSPLMSVCVPLS